MQLKIQITAGNATCGLDDNAYIRAAVSGGQPFNATTNSPFLKIRLKYVLSYATLNLLYTTSLSIPTLTHF